MAWRSARLLAHRIWLELFSFIRLAVAIPKARFARQGLALLGAALVLWQLLPPAPEADARARRYYRATTRRHYRAPVRRAKAEPPKAKKAPLPTRAAFLMNARTGQMLFQVGAHNRMPPASTTKIITALVILDYYRPTEVVTFSERAASTETSNLDVKAGAQFTEEQLLYTILLHSANDACVAMAEHIAGSVENFAILMNNKAKQLGAVDTNFVNPNGLTESGHYSSAYDMALFIRAAMADPRFARVSSTKQHWTAWPGHDKPLLITNHNKLLGVYPGLVGGKTGYTLAARRCFTAYVVRGGTELAMAILGSDNIWVEATALLDYGFKQVQLASQKRGNTAG